MNTLVFTVTVGVTVAVAVTLLAILVIVSPAHQYKIKDNSHWQQLANFTIADSDIEVSKYKSERTGKSDFISSV